MRSILQNSLYLLASLFLLGTSLGVVACRSRVVEVPAGSAGDLAGSPAVAGTCTGNTSFLVGSGVYDITGPAAEVGMMGYGMIDQKTAGIHMRLRARAFVIAAPCNGKRVAFVSADLGQVFQVIKQQVVSRLRTTFGETYTDANVILSATHTHSGPGGISHYALYNLTVLGFNQQNLDAVVHGIYQAIVRAHNNLAAGTITVASGDLMGAAKNRSPNAYLRNPAAERAQYASNTNTLMTLLRLQQDTGAEIGTINWFAVHGTSMGNDNHLISGDNKGYASYLFEKRKGTNYLVDETFVAAFAQSDEGDVTPNIFGGTNGGGANDFESTALAAQKQYTRALALYNSATESLVGGVDYRHAYIRMDAVSVAPAWTDGIAHTTCPAAIGISMLAGAEDGPGFGKEGFTCENVHSLWHAFTCAVTRTACQGEKPIVLEMGSQKPFPWSPEVLPLQLVTLGNLALVATPFEVTTMAGRRLRQTVLATLGPVGVTRVVIVGLANAYAGYMTTREEYDQQDYEGASTHFGPWQLAAVQQEMNRLAVALRDNLPVAPGPTPRDLSCCQTTLQTDVLFDAPPLGQHFGSVFIDADTSYSRGQTVTVVFWGGHPKNDLRLQSSFLQVQRQLTDGTWSVVASDWDWETRYTWKRAHCLACSQDTVRWTIPSTAAPGTYRIRHDGTWKSIDGAMHPYFGLSREFTVN
jgi:neutral ceramidase